MLFRAYGFFTKLVIQLIDGSVPSLALFSIDFDSVFGPLAYRSGRKYFFHRRPIGLNPSPVVTAVAIRRDADLGKFELRSAASLRDIVDSD